MLFRSAQRQHCPPELIDLEAEQEHYSDGDDDPSASPRPGDEDVLQQQPRDSEQLLPNSEHSSTAPTQLAMEHLYQPLTSQPKPLAAHVGQASPSKTLSCVHIKSEHPSPPKASQG